MKKTYVMLAAVMIGVLLLPSCLGARTDAPALDLTSTAGPAAAPLTASYTTTSLPAASTPTFFPTSPQAPTRFEETFADNHNNWYTKEAQVTIADGTYNFVLDCPTSSPSSQCGNFIQIPFMFPTDFQIEIEATITRASDGAGVMVGFEVRRSDDGYYYINYLITQSSYEMSRVTQTGEISIVPKTETDSIAPAVGETNMLGMRVDGAEFTPVVNGQSAPPIRDGNIRAAGDGYLVVLVDRGHTAEVQLDNLVVEKIE